VVQLAALGGQVSAARSAAAKRFAEAVTAELPALAMRDATVTVAVSQTVAGDLVPWLEVGERRLAFGSHGLDDVEMLLRPHKGAPARALQRGASGGELSRVMLAVEVVLAGADPVPTLVFDEVDAGVGGRAAVEVGSRLAALARTAQVLVVTHLPQVAAFADQHLVVRKASDGAVTSSGVTRLDETGRLQELSRMLAGLEESEAAQAHAQELLAVARAAKAV
jgi:DNA repair protein RecN (Recombination protein N)